MENTKKKSKAKKIISLGIILCLVGGLIYYIFNKSAHPGFPEMPSPNINTNIYESIAHDMAVEAHDVPASRRSDKPSYFVGVCQTYDSGNKLYWSNYLTVDGSVSKYWELFYEGKVDNFPVQNTEIMTKLTFNQNYENEEEIIKEQQFMQENLGEHFSNQIKEDLKEDYWVAATYDMNSLTAQYDIAFYRNDFDISNPGLQAVLSYFGFDACYDEATVSFDPEKFVHSTNNFGSRFKGAFNNMIDDGVD